MTIDEAIATIDAHIREIKDWGCIHQDELGTYYAPDAERDIRTWENVRDTLWCAAHQSREIMDTLRRCWELPIMDGPTACLMTYVHDLLTEDAS